MSDPVRVTALSLAWTLAACHRGAEPIVEPISEPGPIAEIESDRGALSITPVPQLTPTELYEWVFEPDGNRFATPEFGDCSIFDIETGLLITSMTVDVETPCDQWLPAGYLVAMETSSDERLEFDASNAAVIEIETSKLVRTLACRDCATSELVAWSRTGHQLAIAWMEPPRVEVWDADSGQKLVAEQIPVAGELEALELGWTAGGATAMWTELGFPVECDAYEYGCEYNEDTQVMEMRPRSRQALVLGAPKNTIPLGDQGAIEDVHFHPSGRWALWRNEFNEGRDGLTFELNIVDLAGPSGAHSWQVDEDGELYEGGMTREGIWRTDGLTHWAVGVTYDDYDGNPMEARWETFIASPPLGVRDGLVLDTVEWDALVEMYVFGFVGDALRVSGEACVHENCTPLGVAPAPNCELLDIGSGHGTELFDCEGQLFIRNGGAMKRLPHDAAALEWWWSRSGALVLNDGAMFTVLDAVSGVGGLQRSGAFTVFDGHLGLEIDRMVLMTDVGIEVLDLSKGKPFAQVTDLFPDDVAFSPTGDRLAVLSQGQVQLLSLPSGEKLASWPCEQLQLAFRQDGKAIFAGMGAPVQAFDAATGKPIELSTELIDASLVGEVDPSWRWIMNDEARQLMRTIDGLVLEFNGSPWLPATGQYQGSGPGPEVAFRVGPDIWAVPEFNATDLAKWLQRGDLVELFLMGQPIPKPSITQAELAGVRAGLEGKK
jgi:hypothetical protein